MKLLLYSLFGDNKPFPFHLWRRETGLQPEKVYKFFQDCVKIFLLVFLLWKCMETPKIMQVLVEKVKPLQYCLVAIRTAFSLKFVLGAKKKNSAFWNISNISLCCNSVALYINFKSKWVFWNTKICINCKFKGSGPSQKWEWVSSDNFVRRIGDNWLERIFFYRMFYN